MAFQPWIVTDHTKRLSDVITTREQPEVPNNKEARQHLNVEVLLQEKPGKHFKMDYRVWAGQR
jgi:hypothetical protein